MSAVIDRLKDEEQKAWDRIVKGLRRSVEGGDGKCFECRMPLSQPHAPTCSQSRVR